MSDFRGMYDVRDATDKDVAFVLATFLRGLYYGDSWFSLIPKDIFMDNYKRVAVALISSPKVTIQIACLKEDPDVILGYSVLSSDFKTIIFLYVKAAWRRKGIGRSLIPARPTQVSHLTALGKSLMDKLPKETIFNPFI